jgi:hypothetical protein
LYLGAHSEAHTQVDAEDMRIMNKTTCQYSTSRDKNVPKHQKGIDIIAMNIKHRLAIKMYARILLMISAFA